MNCKWGRTEVARGQKVVQLFLVLALLSALAFLPLSAWALRGMNEEAGGLYIPLNRSELVIVPEDITEVIIADPDIADVHVIGSRHVAFVAKKLGHTNAKLFDRDNKIIREFDVLVGYDLPGIRKALHNFLPHEHIGVELVNTNIALTGQISDAAVADEALRIVKEFISPPNAGGGAVGGAAGGGAGGAAGGATNNAADVAGATVLNLMKVISGQQVMLRVRIGEIQRNAVKNLGLELAALTGSTRAGTAFGSQGGGQSFVSGTSAPFPGLTIPSAELSTGGIFSGFFRSGEGGLSAALTALETEGVLKVLAEPNLVAMSGEKAEFLAGGEFPVPTVSSGGGTGGASSVPVTSVSFQQYGVAVQFIPIVLSDNRIRLTVQPEVSQIDTSNETTISGTTIPGLDTRRAKTTVELAPGESFMIAGLIQDSLNATVNQVPGASEIPILGSLMRSTTYTRGETELVIAVTPYIVDPLKSSDVRLPTDDFRPASIMEQFFYGALGSMSGNAYRLSQTPSLEGPIGFITE